jgi:hypothetical protein
MFGVQHINGGFRGTRVGVNAGSTSPLQAENPVVVPAPRVSVPYWCSRGHETTAVFALLPPEQIPEVWDCPRCGTVATRTPGAVPPPAAGSELYKSHLEYVKERRTDTEAEQLLEAALLRHRMNDGARSAGPQIPDPPAGPGGQSG